MSDASKTPEEPKTPEQIEAEIAETREELADTVEALAAKTDVKAQAKQKTEDAKAQARQTADDAKTRAQAAAKSPADDPQFVTAVGVGVLVLLILFWRRRR